MFLKLFAPASGAARRSVVILTSSESPHDEANALRHAALHYFRKTSSLDQYMQLGDVVNAIIGRTSRAHTVVTTSENSGTMPVNAGNNIENIPALDPAVARVHTGEEMEDRIRELDWSQTPLGLANTWPQSLRTVVNILLSSRVTPCGWRGDPS